MKWKIQDESTGGRLLWLRIPQGLHLNGLKMLSHDRPEQRTTAHLTCIVYSYSLLRAQVRFSFQIVDPKPLEERRCWISVSSQWVIQPLQGKETFSPFISSLMQAENWRSSSGLKWFFQSPLMPELHTHTRTHEVTVNQSPILAIPWQWLQTTYQHVGITKQIYSFLFNLILFRLKYVFAPTEVKSTKV